MAVHNPATHLALRSGHEQTAGAVIQLASGGVHEIRRACQTIRVISGYAWITFDGNDYVLKSGESIQLTPGRYVAIISSMFKRPLVYELINA